MVQTILWTIFISFYSESLIHKTLRNQSLVLANQTPSSTEEEQETWPLTQCSTSETVSFLYTHPLYIFFPMYGHTKFVLLFLLQLHNEWEIILCDLHKLYLTYISYVQGTRTPTVNCPFQIICTVCVHSQLHSFLYVF